MSTGVNFYKQKNAHAENDLRSRSAFCESEAPASVGTRAMPLNISNVLYLCNFKNIFVQGDDLAAQIMAQ